MKCRYCDGELDFVKSDISKCVSWKFYDIKHKKKRIRKKLAKKKARLFSLLTSPLHPRTFKCSSCGKLEGIYSAFGRSMFPIQKMPDGALLFYLDKHSTI